MLFLGDVWRHFLSGLVPCSFQRRSASRGEGWGSASRGVVCLPLWTDKHLWKYYLPITSLAAVTTTPNYVTKWCQNFTNVQSVNTYRIEAWWQKNKNPVFSEYLRDDIRPSPLGQEWIFIQTLTAAPPGPHLSGKVMQCSDRTPRSTHWFSLESVTTALLIFKKWNHIQSKIWLFAQLWCTKHSKANEAWILIGNYNKLWFTLSINMWALLTNEQSCTQIDNSKGICCICVLSTSVRL